MFVNGFSDSFFHVVSYDSLWKLRNPFIYSIFIEAAKEISATPIWCNKGTGTNGFANLHMEYSSYFRLVVMERFENFGALTDWLVDHHHKTIFFHVTFTSMSNSFGNVISVFTLYKCVFLYFLRLTTIDPRASKFMNTNRTIKNL